MAGKVNRAEEIMADRAERQMVPIKILPVDTVEEMVLNPDALHPALRDWRFYRVSYGGVNEDCIYEGRILLPRKADPEALVQLILGMQAYSELWRDEEDMRNDAEAEADERKTDQGPAE